MVGENRLGCSLPRTVGRAESGSTAGLPLIGRRRNMAFHQGGSCRLFEPYGVDG